MLRSLALVSAVAVLTAEPSAAQLITVRTSPIAQAEQFDLFPSNNAGMGGAIIALHDTLSDPFRNPALGSRLTVGRVFSAPGLFSVSSQSGGGRTLPIGALVRFGDWFGGIGVALQEIEPARRTLFSGGVRLELPGAPPLGGPAGPGSPIDVTPDTRAHGNAFGTLIAGRRLSNGLAIAGSVQHGRLGAMDGVDVMYTNSVRVGQSGSWTDARVGLLREFSGDESFELVAVHNRLRVQHDVTMVDLFWDPGTQSPVGVGRAETNFDHTSTWGLHAGYQRPIPGSAWRIGGIVTANHIQNPRAPRYDVMNLPSDPGSADALNLGIGLSRRIGSETFGLDAIYEPMRAHSRAYGAGGALARDNRYRFSNGTFRMGFGWDLDPSTPDRGATLQLGLLVRAVRYRLDQQNFETGTTRALTDAWTEWTPTWGLGLALPSFQIRYRGRVSHGTRRPVVPEFGGGCCITLDPIGPGGFIPTPVTATLSDVHIVTHQVSISLPLR